MSDFLISEMLVLILLIPSIIRPFSKNLKRAGAICILPIFSAFVLGLLITAHGIYVSLIPVIFFVLICIITEFARFVMFLNHLPNNFYSIPSILLRFFLLVISFFVFALIIYMPPQKHLQIINSPVSAKSINFTRSGEEVNAGNIYTPNKILTGKEKTTIILLNNLFNSSNEPNTIARYLLNEGYKVIEINTIKKTDKLFTVKRFEKFKESIKMLFNKQSEQKILTKDEFKSVISKITEEDNKIYIFTEEPYIDFILEYSKNNPDSFTGIFYMISEDNDIYQKILMRSPYILEEKKGLKFSENIRLNFEALFIRKKECFTEIGELRSEDPLSAFFWGASKDTDRQDRIFIAKTFQKWLELK